MALPWYKGSNDYQIFNHQTAFKVKNELCNRFGLNENISLNDLYKICDIRLEEYCANGSESHTMAKNFIKWYKDMELLDLNFRDNEGALASYQTYMNYLKTVPSGSNLDNRAQSVELGAYSDYFKSPSPKPMPGSFPLVLKLVFNLVKKVKLLCYHQHIV